MISEPLITLDTVSCRYSLRNGMFRRKSFTAVKDISLTIYRGESLGVIGRNGAGKSSLLKILAGIYQPDSGTVTYHTKISVAMISLQAGMDPELPGTTNAILSAMLLGFSKQQALSKLQDIIEFAELGEWIYEPVKTYSTGMRARLGFAVSLQLSPDVILIDEALGVGDQHFKEKSIRAMKSKILSTDHTVVFVSHTIPQVRELCNRVAWIEHGELKMIDEPRAVIKAYQEANK